MNSTSRTEYPVASPALAPSPSALICLKASMAKQTYPAAGDVCLAIEALRQISALGDGAKAGEATGYSVRDVEFMQALLIPDSSDGIEIQTTMRSVDDKTARSRG